jgi:hypothetical protein
VLLNRTYECDNASKEWLRRRARRFPSDLYRKYFMDIRKFGPFPMTVSYENVLDFVEWLKRQ